MKNSNRFGLLIGYLICLAFLGTGYASVRPAPPKIQTFAPAIAGVGGQLQLDGLNFGSEADTVVVFNSSVIAEKLDTHTSTEIIARVPLGAVTGPVAVVSGVNAPLLRYLQGQIELLQGIDSELIQQQIQYLEKQKRILLVQPTPRLDVINVTVTFGFLTTTPSEIGPAAEDSEGLPYLEGRVVVDLKGVESFDVALAIAAELDADLTGYFPASNSYVLDLRHPPMGLDGLDQIVQQLDRDPRVQEAWEDMVLEPQQQVKFADVDVVDRYRHTDPKDHPADKGLDGRTDAWTTDRIQAPGAWNLLERFIPARDGKASGRASLFPMKISVLDSGVDQQHPEFAGVRLKKVGITYVAFNIRGQRILLPVSIQDKEDYSNGDFRSGGIQHGTAVASLIGAANGVAIPGVTNRNPDGDRGINGLLHNPMEYTIQVGQLRTVCDELVGINAAALTGARVVNMSWGQDHPVNPDKGNFFRVLLLRFQLNALAKNLSVFQNSLLLVAAAGNNGLDKDPDGLKGRVLGVYEKNLPGQPPGGLDFPVSMGTLNNVLAVASINNNDQLSGFSNWGTPVQIGAPGEQNFMAGECQTAVGRRCDFQIGDAYYMKLTTGTSFAAPLVSGTTALLLGINPGLTAAQLKNYATSTAFFVNTATQVNTLNNWPTLKSGFAVRQVLLDTPLARFGIQRQGNLINKDDPWTGVSKIAYYSRAPQRTNKSALRLAEVRRANDGRSEAFAVRNFQLNGGPLVLDTGNSSLTHDGRWLAFAKDNKLQVSTFDSGKLFTALSVTELNQRALQIGPAREFLVGASAHLNNAPGMCRFQLVWLPRQLGAYKIVASTNTQQCGKSDDPTVGLYDVAWKADNREWALEFYAGNKEGSITANLSDSQKKFVPIKFSTALQGELQAWSADGGAWARQSTGSNVLEILYIGTFVLQGEEIPDGLTSLTWAPDGSELAYSTGASDKQGACTGCIVNLRRDFRDKSDRKRKVMIDESKTAFRISSVSWQW